MPEFLGVLFSNYSIFCQMEIIRIVAFPQMISVAKHTRTFTTDSLTFNDLRCTFLQIILVLIFFRKPSHPLTHPNHKKSARKTPERSCPGLWPSRFSRRENFRSIFSFGANHSLSVQYLNPRSFVIIPYKPNQRQEKRIRSAYPPKVLGIKTLGT